jgi:hypothetical protein
VRGIRGEPPRTRLFGNGHARKTRIMTEAFIPRRRRARIWHLLLLGVFVMMTMTLAAARGRCSGLVGDRLDRGALADLSVQPLHRLVADDNTTVRGDFLACVRVFFPGNADRDMKRLDDHRSVGPPGNPTRASKAMTERTPSIFIVRIYSLAVERLFTNPPNDRLSKGE